MRTIGIDIGTTSICAVLYHAGSGIVEESMTRQNDFLSGGFCQDPEKIVSIAQELLDALLDRHEDVAAVGISSQMHGILYVDDQGRAVSDFYTWKETCGNESFGEGSFATFLSDKTGYPMHTGYGTVTHFALQQRGEISPRAKVFVSIGDYLAMRLCGCKAPKMDPTMAASLGGFCLERGCFDFEKLESAGVNTSFYPEITASSFLTDDMRIPTKKGNVQVLGKRTAGIYRNVPVCWAVGDNQASFYAAAGEREDTILVNVGTGSQVSVFGRRLTVCEAGEIRPFVKKGYLYVQASLNGGKVYEKLAAFFEEIMVALTGKKADGYEFIQRLGMEREKTDLVIKPALYGSRREAGGFGTAENLTEANFHPSDLIRAYVAGMADELHQLYEEFPEELKAGRRSLTASGNGIRKNKMLRQEIEGSFQMPLLLSDILEEAAAGAAQLAAEER